MVGFCFLTIAFILLFDVYLIHFEQVKNPGAWMFIVLAELGVIAGLLNIANDA